MSEHLIYQNPIISCQSIKLNIRYKHSLSHRQYNVVVFNTNNYCKYCKRQYQFCAKDLLLYAVLLWLEQNEDDR